MISNNPKKVFITFILTIFISNFSMNVAVFGQCTSEFVIDYSDGTGFTYRTSGWMMDVACSDSPNSAFICDSSWSVQAIIKNEKDLLRDGFCKNSLLAYHSYDSVNLLRLNENDFLEVVMVEAICKQDDSKLQSYKNRFVKSENDFIRAHFALHLMSYESPKANDLLKELSNDPCEYVLLEVARSLSYQGEKDISFRLFDSIWNLDNKYINLDKFNYFTGGMRNIHSDEAIAFLKKLSAHDNKYCALDASICLLQLKETDPGMDGVQNVLKEKELTLFMSGIRALMAYIPKQKLTDILSEYSNCEIREIREFVVCFLDEYN